MSDIENEAENDIEFLNNFKSEIIESAHVKNQSLLETNTKIIQTLSKADAIKPDQEEFLRVFSNALPDIQNLLDVEGIKSSDLVMSIKKIASGEMSKSDIEALLKIRNELRKYQDSLLNVTSNLMSKAGLIPLSIFQEFLRLVPPDRFEKQRKSLERLSKTFSESPIGGRILKPEDLNLTYYYFVQLAQVIAIFLKWIDYELDTFLRPSVMSSSDTGRIRKAVAEILRFFNNNPALIQLAQIIAIIFIH